MDDKVIDGGGIIFVSFVFYFFFSSSLSHLYNIGRHKMRSNIFCINII